MGSESFASSDSLSIAGCSTLFDARDFLGAGFFERDVLVSAGDSLTTTGAVLFADLLLVALLAGAASAFFTLVERSF